MYLSVVIPSYNELENLRRGALAEVRDYLKKQKYSWEVVVSDDGSTDQESRKLAKEFCNQNNGFTFLENAHGGKPFALWSGIKAAKGEIILLTDMDQSAPMEETGRLLPYYDQGYDVVIGSRGTQRKNFSLFRKLASMIFRAIRRSLLLWKIIDTQAGFKSMRRSVALETFPRLQVIKTGSQNARGWTVGSWDAEFLFIAEKYGYKIKEVPIRWEDRDVSTKKNRAGGQFVKESIDMFEQIVRVRLNDIRGYYRK